MILKKTPYSQLDTPAVLVDLDKMEANINEMAQVAAEAGIRLRPHCKVHQSPIIAKMELKAGACGIEVGTIDQAEGMAKAGISDIVIAHPFFGDQKFRKIRKLLVRQNLKLTLLVDMIEQAQAISQIGADIGKNIPILIKIDTGLGRFGVLPGQPTLKLAKQIKKLKNVDIIGIYAHETRAVPTVEGIKKKAFDDASAMVETARLLKAKGFAMDNVAVGSSPTFKATCEYIKEGKFPEITEIHPGHFVFGDINYSLGLEKTRAALSVLTTVISTSHSESAVLDIGFKTVGNDELTKIKDEPNYLWKGNPSYGLIKGRPDLWLGHMHAETAQVDYKDPNKKLKLGDRLEVVPNNATILVNNHDILYGVRNGVVELEIPLPFRGKGN